MTRISIRNLPEDMQVLLSQIAMDSGKWLFRDQKDSERFGNVELPLFDLPLEAFPAEIEGHDPGDDRSFEDYLDTPIEDFPPVVIAHGYWIDGRHRLWAARTKGVGAIHTIDASCVFGRREIFRWKFLGPMRLPKSWKPPVPCALP